MKSSIGSDAIKISTSKIITMVISLLSAMLLSRTRSLEEYGIYSQLLLIVNLITTVFMLGLPNSINYFLASEERVEKRQEFLSSYYTLSTLLGIVSGLFAVLLTPFLISYFNNPLLSNFIYFLALIPWTKIIMSSIEYILIIYNRTNYLMIYRILHSISLLLIIAIADYFNLSFIMYILLFVIVEILFSVSVYVIVKNISKRLYISFNKKIMLSIFKFSIPIGLASVVSTLSVELDKLLIGRYFTTEQLAIYTNAARELPVSIITSALTAVLLPLLVRLLRAEKYNKGVELWGISIKLSYIFISIIAFGVFVFAPEVMTILYSEKYIDGTTVFRIYSLLLLLRPTYFGIILNAKGKTKFIFYTSLLSLGLNAVLNSIFYIVIGFNGPAIATLVSVTAVQLLQLIVTGRVINVGLRRLFPWKELLTITIINIIFAIVFGTLKTLLNLDLVIGDVGEALALGGIWTVIYFGVMLNKIKVNWTKLNKNH